MVFEAGNETREKIWSDFGAERKWKAERKESGFLFIPLFSRELEIDVWKKILSERIFCSRAAFKSSFLQLLMVMRFDIDIVLILGWFQ